MNRIRTSLVFVILFTSLFCPGQTTILNTLYLESVNVFKGKVKYLNNTWSNDAGVEFSVYVEVEKYYKNNRMNGLDSDQAEQIFFSVWARQMLFPNYDTAFHDWTRWLTKDSTYIFFLDEWESTNRRKGYKSARLIDDKFEAVSFSPHLENTFSKFEHRNGFPHCRDAQYKKAFELLKNNSDTIMLAKVQSIKHRKDHYRIELETAGDKEVLLTKTTHCLSPGGHLEKDQYYVFYCQYDVSGELQLTDEYLGVSLASSYEKFIDSIKRKEKK